MNEHSGIHQWGRVTFDLDNEVITWPDGRQSGFMRYATKRLPTDAAPHPTDLFRFRERWTPTTVRSAVYTVPRPKRKMPEPIEAGVALLLIAAAIALCTVILTAF